MIIVRLCSFSANRQIAASPSMLIVMDFSIQVETRPAIVPFQIWTGSKLDIIYLHCTQTPILTWLRASLRQPLSSPSIRPIYRYVKVTEGPVLVYIVSRLGTHPISWIGHLIRKRWISSRAVYMRSIKCMPHPLSHQLYSSRCSRTQKKANVQSACLFLCRSMLMYSSEILYIQVKMLRSLASLQSSSP